MTHHPDVHAQKSAGLAAIVEEPGRSTGAKVREWIARYGLAECAGVACALIGSFAVRRATGSAVAAAYGGAWGETIGYAGVIIARELFAEERTAHAEHQRFGLRDVRQLFTDLLAEFGPSGVLDTMVVRPACMGLGARWLGAARGLIAGKLVADVLFYIPVIYMYERRKHARRERRYPDDSFGR